MTIKFPKWLLGLSDRVDSWFKVPDTSFYKTAKEQQDIEEITTRLFDDIGKCRSLKYSYEIEDHVRDLYRVYGRKAQVVACYDSLMLALRNRQKEILATA